jgi:hypothetical protein
MAEVAPIIEAQLAAAAELRRAARQQQEAAAAPREMDGAVQRRGEEDGGSGSNGDGALAAPELSARARRRLRNAELKEARRAARRAAVADAKAAEEAAAGDALAAAAAAHPAGGGGGGSDVEAADSGGGAANEWEVFFRAHPTARFFRERRYLGLSFPCLAPPGGGGGGGGEGAAAAAAAEAERSSGAAAEGGGGAALGHILELGAGCGSSILPLLKLHPSARATVCDVSATCLRQLRAAAAADGVNPGRVAAFVADATDPMLGPKLAADPADAALIMFTLSAVPPTEAGMVAMMRNAAAGLRRGGRLCVRDHALGDMVQLRIPPEQVVFSGDGCGGGGGEGGGGGGGKAESGGGSGGSGAWAWREGLAAAAAGAAAAAPWRAALAARGPFWYRRGDGTLAYFYTTEELAAMGAAAGLAAARCEYVCVLNRNRRSGQALRRVFVQAEFVKP